MGLFNLAFARKPSSAVTEEAEALSKEPKSWEAGFLDFLLTQRSTSSTGGVTLPAAPPTPFQLDDLPLCMVLTWLSPRELVNAQLVCKQWRAVAREASVIKASFMNAWSLKSLNGEPRSWAVAEYATVKHFVRKHVVCKTDTLAKLAVLHQSDVTTLKRMNNMTTDHVLHSRTYVWIPVRSLEDIKDKDAAFVFCPISAREYIQISDKEGEGHKPSAEASKPDPHAAQKLARMLGRSLRVDEFTAQFYLSEAEGDIKKAMRLAEQDAEWERVGNGAAAVRRHAHTAHHTRAGHGARAPHGATVF